MTDFDKLDQQYRDEGWGRITDEALPGVRPSNVESQARVVATWCVGRISALEAKLAEGVKVKPEHLATVTLWREWAAEWAGSAWVADEALPLSAMTDSEHKGELYSSLCRLMNHMEWLHDELSALEATPPAMKVTEDDVARRIFNDAHAGMRNCYDWDTPGLEDEHPGTIDRYRGYARSAIAALTAAQGEED